MTVTAKHPRLNVGCGRRCHSDWINLDLEACVPEVVEHDITQGLPFDDSQFEAVYHSHVLEHLSPEAGRKLTEECLRVLKPGGVLRIVVPDLEQIAKLYLETHQRAWASDRANDPNYDWMKLELLDQLVRHHSGGRMGRYMADKTIANAEFVRSRLGDEFAICQNHAEATQPVQTVTARLSQTVDAMKKSVTRKLVRWILGHQAEVAFEEGLFRHQGEIHRWMYDRFSLKQLCESAGFKDFSICDCLSSRISGFADFELDAIAGRIRKPDSLFAECIKPA